MGTTADMGSGPPPLGIIREWAARDHQNRPSPKRQLGDFSLVYTFLSATSEPTGHGLRDAVADKLAGPAPNSSATSRPAGHKPHDVSVAERLAGLVQDVQDTPTPISKATEQCPEARSFTMTPVVTPQPSLSTVLRAAVAASATRQEGLGSPAFSLPVEFQARQDALATELPLDISQQLWENAKSRTLTAKLRLEMSIDLRIGVKKQQPVTHIFIDMSNIYIGFNDAVKAAKGIPDHVRAPRAPLDFEALSRILERGRTIGAREVVGSAADPENVPDLPQYFHDAKSLAYETSILRRVLKPSKASQGASSPLSTSSESGDYCGVSRRDMSYREQGVDEILQLKMGNTAMAYMGNPGTMVLATGDAEKAEYSDGFQKQVERILKMGWIVEVVSWKRGLSYAWKRSNWTQKWGDQFRTILLDPFVDELLAT